MTDLFRRPREPYRLIKLPEQMRHSADRLHQLADVERLALRVTEAMREHDPAQIATELQAIAHTHPLVAAQLVMCLAVWVPMESMTPADLDRQADLVAYGGTSKETAA